MKKIFLSGFLLLLGFFVQAQCYLMECKIIDGKDSCYKLTLQPDFCEIQNLLGKEMKPATKPDNHDPDFLRILDSLRTKLRMESSVLYYDIINAATGNTVHTIVLHANGNNVYSATTNPRPMPRRRQLVKTARSLKDSGVGKFAKAYFGDTKITLQLNK